VVRAVHVRYADTLPATAPARSPRTRVAAHARRYLSEIRDDFLCRHERLLSPATHAVRGLSRLRSWGRR
jgi:hypothetical protein